MRSILRAWPSLDPRTGIAVFAAWAGLSGLTLAGPGAAYEHSAIYSELQLYVEERPLGLLMLGSAWALLWSIRERTALSFRLAVAAGCGSFWLLVGCLLLAGGAGVGTVTAAGTFAVLGGAGCLGTIRQWSAMP